MKTIKVVAAIIVNNDKIFATQRGYGEFKDGWEFPGGKIEQNETAEAAIVREIQEDYSDYDEIDKDLLMELCDEHNLDFYSLTQNDIDTINNAI